MAAVQYYAITQFGTTKENPFAIARYNNGAFERYHNGSWVKDSSLSAIFSGDFIDYEIIKETEALQIIKRQGKGYVQ